MILISNPDRCKYKGLLFTDDRRKQKQYGKQKKKAEKYMT
jgi:hypothetical protein